MRRDRTKPCARPKHTYTSVTAAEPFRGVAQLGAAYGAPRGSQRCQRTTTNNRLCRASGHREVVQQDVETFALQDVQGLFGGVDRGDVGAIALQHVRHDIEDIACVVDDQNPHTGEPRTMTHGGPSNVGDVNRAGERPLLDVGPTAAQKRRVRAWPEALPEEAAADRASYERVGTRSHLSIPLQAGGPMLGVLSFDSVRAERDWPDELVERLRLLSEAFASALQRKRMESVLGERLHF